MWEQGLLEPGEAMLPLPGREEEVEEEDLPRQLPGQEEPAVVECGGSTRMTPLG